jgi:hypothetical protein
MTDAMSEHYGTRRPQTLLASVVFTLLILGFGFVVFSYTPALLISLYGGMVASYVAVPYTVFAIVAREVRARRGRARDRVEAAAGLESTYRSDALEFGLFRQRASLVTAIVMLAALIAAVVMAAVRAWGDQSGFGSDPMMSLSTLGAFAFIGGVFAIIVNVPSIYSDPVVQAERHAMRARVGAWRLILATTVLTTVSWLAYCGFAVFFIASTWP